jgi:hypothetical protein
MRKWHQCVCSYKSSALLFAQGELTVLGKPPTMRSGLRHITLVLSTMAASTKVSRSKVIQITPKNGAESCRVATCADS